MAKRHPEITAELRRFIEVQPMFFVATAGSSGRANLSPKGLAGTFAVLEPHRVAFLNLTGSGNETAAHLRLDRPAPQGEIFQHGDHGGRGEENEAPSAQTSFSGLSAVSVLMSDPRSCGEGRQPSDNRNSHHV